MTSTKFDVWTGVVTQEQTWSETSVHGGGVLVGGIIEPVRSSSSVQREFWLSNSAGEEKWIKCNAHRFAIRPSHVVTLATAKTSNATLLVAMRNQTTAELAYFDEHITKILPLFHRWILRPIVGLTIALLFLAVLPLLFFGGMALFPDAREASNAITILTVVISSMTTVALIGWLLYRPVSRAKSRYKEELSELLTQAA